LEPLAVLLIAEAPAHGYDLLPRLVEFGLDAQNVDPGTLYRTLRRLEDDGILRSEWSTDGSGPARRVYSVTPEGYEFLRSWHTAIAGIRESLGRFLGASGGVLGREAASGPGQADAHQ
jgi:DNA-binding PadR family transcriptional regulator